MLDNSLLAKLSTFPDDLLGRNVRTTSCKHTLHFYAVDVSRTQHVVFRSFRPFGDITESSILRRFIAFGVLGNVNG